MSISSIQTQRASGAFTRLLAIADIGGSTFHVAELCA